MQDSKETKPSCHEISSQGHLYVEGELDPLRSSRLEAHLESCAPCRRAIEELSEERLWIMDAVISTPRLPARFASKVTERIRKEREGRTLRRWFGAACTGLSFTTAAALALLTVSLLSVEEGPRADRELAGSPAVPEAAALRRRAVERRAVERRAVERRAVERRAVEREGAGGGIADPAVTITRRYGARSEGARESRAPDVPFAPLERGCSVEGLDDEVDPLFPSTALVCASCADPEVVLSGARSEDGPEDRTNVDRPRFRDAVVLAFEIEKAETTRASAPSPSGDPCVRDPNADGRHDGSDVALYLQQVLASDTLPGKAGLAALQTAASEERPCEEICVGA